MNELYSTSEAARILEVNASTIRTWKSRQSSRFAEGKHFVKSDTGSILWTQAGIAELKRIAAHPETQTVSPATEDEGQGILQRYDTLLDEIADAIAPHLMDRLDHKVTQRLVSVSRKPVNSIAVLQSLGLKPANLNLLGASDE